MDEMNMINDVTDEIEVTDLADVNAEATGNSEGGIGAGEIVLGSLALVGAGFIVKKTVDAGKWVAGKAKSWNESRKEKKAAKAAAEADEDFDEIVEDVVEDEQSSNDK